MFDSVFIHPDYFKISYFTLVILLLNTVTAFHILLNKHEQPVSAVMWLLLVYFIPLLGLTLYLFFGINLVSRATKRPSFSVYFKVMCR